jgi:hypothetical protein
MSVVVAVLESVIMETMEMILIMVMMVILLLAEPEPLNKVLVL